MTTTERARPTSTAPGRSPVAAMLARLHARLQPVSTGSVATYIPALAAAPADALGIALATLDGYVHTAGDVDVPFTIQSVSKPFVYALALADRGPDGVHARIGVEPTGEAFNTIAVDEVAGRARNPMVNAGAIVAASLVDGADPAAKLERIRCGLSVFAGRDLEVDEEVWRSERLTGSRNRAIGHMLWTAGALTGDVDDALDVYFGQCSLSVTARDLAVMVATLANDGVNPRTGARAMSADDVGRVLSVMATCGMYDYAGEWLYEVGLPAKSGVSGDIAAVLPGQMGIGLYSPRLDERGNSVRGIAACRELSNVYDLHMLRPAGHRSDTSGRSFSAAAVHSSRAHTDEDLALLAEHGSTIAVHEVQGEQSFATAEALVRRIEDGLDEVDWIVLDLRRCGRIDRPAKLLVDGLLNMLDERGVTTVAVDPRPEPVLGRPMADDAVAPRRFADLDTALEWCERELLTREGSHVAPGHRAPVALADQELLADLDAAQVAVVERLTALAILGPGAVVFEEGEATDGIYFVSSGRVAADIAVGDPVRRSRISTLGPGQSFGEMGVLEGVRRSSRIVAEVPTRCHVLTNQALMTLQAEHPEICMTIHKALARNLSERLRHTTRLLRTVQS
ncbi:MAG: glutaminase A [Actinomycetota bacterium]|nr:glutaminase A [Actinomycetota bacterium]